MPMADLVKNSQIARKPLGGDIMADCKCKEEEKHVDYCCYPYPPTPTSDCCCPPPPFPYPPYNYPYDMPVAAPAGSIEIQIAKLSKKSAAVRKQIENLVKKNKPIMVSIGGVSYNYGTYKNTEGETTDYGTKILEMLESELNSIKEKIVELTGELEATTDVAGDVEKTITQG